MPSRLVLNSEEQASLTIIAVLPVAEFSCSVLLMPLLMMEPTSLYVGFSAKSVTVAIMWNIYCVSSMLE